MTEPLSDSELSEILADATRVATMRFMSLPLARLLLLSIPGLVSELRLTREQLQSSRDQCRTMRAIIEQAEVAT